MTKTSRFRSHCFPIRQNGLAVVEFAISVVVILLLMLVTAEIGRAFYSYNSLTKTVRNGARYFSTIALNEFYEVDLTSTDGLQRMAETRNVVVTGVKDNSGTPLLNNFSTTDVTITEVLPSSPAAINSYITVAANYTFVPIFSPIQKMGISNDYYDFSFPMRVSSTMRVQR